MLHFSLNSLFLFTAFLLVKLNIILLNEESLILGCFILFCILSKVKLGPQISSYFQDQLLAVHNSLSFSNKQFLKLISGNKKQLAPTLLWPQELQYVKKHVFQFNRLVIKNWPKVYTLQVQEKLFKKLAFSCRLEQQITKLVSLVLIEKVKHNVTLHQFCVKKLVIKRSKSLEKIYFREYLTRLV